VHVQPVTSARRAARSQLVIREEDTFYPALGLLTEEEFGLRERALQDSLASGEHLSGWVPPWRASS